jgi:3-phenylpropionate/trans-cinnamate dioxygenase ferredoxin reductase subunit
MARQQTYVIVGASLTGAKAAQTLREDGCAGRIVLIGSEAEPPYERPPLSKGYLLGREERAKIYVHEARWYDENSVELLLGRRVTRLNRGAHEVELRAAWIVARMGPRRCRVSPTTAKSAGGPVSGRRPSPGGR